ncbi:hypothetical protein DFJ66_2882 [Saccharothrix variisporea]|uniref:Uncharacterized protein n=1 Tax=Saccharothrix variisporea TaxID=543527 RepID=A0A495XDN0_9PSEU|nr:hypothetical protein DFJ66_2882 [Saccharothrix variisporea]
MTTKRGSQFHLGRERCASRGPLERFALVGAVLLT